MILTITENDPDRELQQVRELVAGRIAGPVISPSTHPHPQTLRLLASLPVVELHRSADLGGPGVVAVDATALSDAVVHLAGLGHGEIADVGTPRALSHGATRLRGVLVHVERPAADHRRGHAELDRRAAGLLLAELETPGAAVPVPVPAHLRIAGSTGPPHETSAPPDTGAPRETSAPPDTGPPRETGPPPGAGPHVGAAARQESCSPHPGGER